MQACLETAQSNRSSLEWLVDHDYRRAARRALQIGQLSGLAVARHVFGVQYGRPIRGVRVQLAREQGIQRLAQFDNCRQQAGGFVIRANVTPTPASQSDPELAKRVGGLG